MVVNLSVWSDIASLEADVYGTAHAALLTRRRMCFTRMETPSLVLQWVPDGSLPAPEESHERLVALESDGPSPFAFTPPEPFGSEGLAPDGDTTP